jgi:hypothetical protein
MTTDIALALQHGTQVEELRRRHRTGLLALVFTDLVDSVALGPQLGDSGRHEFVASASATRPANPRPLR